MSNAAELERGKELLIEGRLADAADVFRAMLDTNPEDADALNLLSVVFQSAGNFDMAVQLSREACRIVPDFFAFYVNYGNALQKAGTLEEAVEAFAKAAELNPKDATAAGNVANALNELERFDEALSAAEKALKIEPDNADILVNKGNALAGLEKLGEAASIYKQTLGKNPTHTLAHFNLGKVLGDMGQPKNAINHLKIAINGQPSNPRFHYCMGHTLQAMDNYIDAIEAYKKALTLDGTQVDAINNLASALLMLDRTIEAVDVYRGALKIEPESPDLHWNLSLSLLKTGQYEEGWQEYEWRWKTPTFIAFRRPFEKPEWDGTDLGDKTLFLHTEQGFGDGIMFCRFAKQALEKGSNIILECRPELKRLFATLDDRLTIIGLGDDVPDHDVQLPLMSLPRVLGTTLETLPADVPYLAVPDDAHLPDAVTCNDGFKIAFVWAGSATRPDNAKRSCAPKHFEEMATLAGTQWFSLQIGPQSGEIEQLSHLDNVHDITSEISDFADTAAVLDAMDLVITIDTGVMHLAGALGKPVLGLMSAPTGFLWMEARSDSPWYPNTKLFRQEAPGQWDKVFDEAKAALEKILNP